MSTKKDLMKSSALIEIEHKITLLEHHIHNALLAHAFNEMNTTNVHTISVKALKEYVPSINNTTHLKKMLESLVDTKVEYNIYEKDKIDIWGKFSLLASVRLDKFNKECTYSFPPELIPALSNPRVYAKINLKLQKEYKGGQYGWALYELCWDYKTSISKGATPEVGRTPEKTIQILRKFFGIALDKYKQYKDFNKRVLIPAINEVNLQTSIFLQPEFIKKGHTVTGIIFHITENKQHKKNIPLTVYKPIVSLPVYNNITVLLKKIKVSDNGVRFVLKRYTYPQIEDAVKAFYEYEAKGKTVEYPTRWIKKALLEGWEPLGIKSPTVIDKAAENAEYEAERQKYKSMTDEEKFEYMLEKSELLRSAYDKLTVENQNKLMIYAYEVVFTSFSHFKMVYPPIMNKARDLKNK